MFKKKWSRSDIPQSVSAGPEKEHSALVVDAEWSTSSEGKPSDEKIVASLADAREELGRLRKTFGSCDNIVSLALASVAALERGGAGLGQVSEGAAREKASEEVARPPQADRSVERQIAALRESLGDESPQETKGSSSSKEEEHVLVTPIKGVDKDGRLILGDPKILSASALKI